MYVRCPFVPPWLRARAAKALFRLPMGLATGISTARRLGLGAFAAGIAAARRLGSTLPLQGHAFLGAFLAPRWRHLAWYRRMPAAISMQRFADNGLRGIAVCLCLLYMYII